MPLQAPILDQRKYEEIYREALLRIPRYTLEWTDFNNSDPGITMIQLFSWLTEMMLYQMSRVPKRNYIKFLQMLNMELRPADPAQAHVTFTPAADVMEPFVRQRTQILAEGTDGDALIFDLEEGIGLIRQPLIHVQVYDGMNFTVVTTANIATETPFHPLG